MGIFPFPFLQLDHECVIGKIPLQVNDLEHPLLCLALVNDTLILSTSLRKRVELARGILPAVLSQVRSLEIWSSARRI